MSKIEKILIPVVLIAAGGICALWIHEHQQNSRLALELKAKQTELEQVEASRRGLAQANEQLKSRLNRVEQAAVALRAAPRPIASAREEDIAPDPVFAEQFRDLPESEENPNEPTILSPEELAERQRREEQRAAERAERENRRQEFRERITTDLQTRRNFFSQINTEGLAPEYQEAHQKLMQSLVYTEELMNKMAEPDLSREERRDVGRELWGQARQMGDLMEMQREVLLNDYAELSLGLSREQTQQFLDYMNTVERMTSGSPMRGGGGGGPGGR